MEMGWGRGGRRGRFYLSFGWRSEPFHPSSPDQNIKQANPWDLLIWGKFPNSWHSPLINREKSKRSTCVSVNVKTMGWKRNSCGVKAQKGASGDVNSIPGSTTGSLYNFGQVAEPLCAPCTMELDSDQVCKIGWSPWMEGAKHHSHGNQIQFTSRIHL